MRLLACLILAGCWSSPRPTGPAALLRRYHAPGDVFRICQRGDGVVTTAALPKPITLVVRSIEDERLLTVRSRELELRRDTVSVSARMLVPERDPVVIDHGVIEGTAFTIDDRNRGKDVGFQESPAGGTDQFSLSFLPFVSYLFDLSYPERAIRKHESFPLRVHTTRSIEGSLPSQIAIDLTFTVREVTPEHVVLGCEGKHVESARHGKESASVVLAVTCRAQIDRRDGRTARWWIDATGDTKLASDAAFHIRSHYDIAIGATEDASDVCARAADPST